MRRYILKGNRRWDMDSNGWYNYGNFLLNEHKVEEAIEAYTRGIKLDPENPFLFYGLGSAYHALNKYSDAIANYSKAIELDPKNVDALEARANVYVSLGLSCKLASRDYQQTIESKETIEKESETDIQRDYYNAIEVVMQRSQAGSRDGQPLSKKLNVADNHMLYLQGEGFVSDTKNESEENWM